MWPSGLSEAAPRAGAPSAAGDAVNVCMRWRKASRAAGAGGCPQAPQAGEGQARRWAKRAQVDMTGAVDRKREDALATIEAMRQDRAGATTESPDDFPFERTVFFDRACADGLVHNGDGTFLRVAEILGEVRLRPWDYVNLRRQVTGNLMAHLTPAPHTTEAETAVSVAQLRRSGPRRTDEEWRDWLEAQGRTEEEFASLVHEEILSAGHRPPGGLNMPLLRALRVDASYQAGTSGSRSQGPSGRRSGPDAEGTRGQCEAPADRAQPRLANGRQSYQRVTERLRADPEGTGGCAWGENSHSHTPSGSGSGYDDATGRPGLRPDPSGDGTSTMSAPVPGKGLPGPLRRRSRAVASQRVLPSVKGRRAGRPAHLTEGRRPGGRRPPPLRRCASGFPEPLPASGSRVLGPP